MDRRDVMLVLEQVSGKVIGLTLFPKREMSLKYYITVHAPTFDRYLSLVCKKLANKRYCTSGKSFVIKPFL